MWDTIAGIISVYLFPFYVSFLLFSLQENLGLLDDVIIEKCRRTGCISDVDRILGYDCVLLLCILVEMNSVEGRDL